MICYNKTGAANGSLDQLMYGLPHLSSCLWKPLTCSGLIIIYNRVIHSFYKNFESEIFLTFFPIQVSENILTLNKSFIIIYFRIHLLYRSCLQRQNTCPPQYLPLSQIGLNVFKLHQFTTSVCMNKIQEMFITLTPPPLPQFST